MCILALALNANDDFPAILLFNRDERFDRPTTSLKVHDDGLVCAKDMQAGGTWMALHRDSGAFAALTNVRCSPQAGVQLQSRGQLLSRVLQGDTDALQSDAYAQFNLLHGVLRTNRPSDVSLSASTPSDRGEGAWRTQTVPVSVPNDVPTVLVKTNDSTGLFTAKGSPSGDSAWPKAAWLRVEVEQLLQTAPACVGRAGAELLLHLLLPAMSATSLPEPQAFEAATARGEFSHVPESLERKYQAAPFIEPLDQSQGEGDEPVWYGTVSQTAIFVCRSECAAYIAYREIARPAPLACSTAGAAAHSDWQWVCVPLVGEHC